MNRNLFEDKRAVSPVIAIILMVVITVVLAATMYTMIEPDPDTANVLYGTMELNNRVRSEDRISFRLHLQKPRAIHVDYVEVYVYDENETEVDFSLEENNYNWTRLPDRDGKIRTDAILSIVVDGAYDYLGYEVLIIAHDYPGSIKYHVTVT